MESLAPFCTLVGMAIFFFVLFQLKDILDSRSNNKVKIATENRMAEEAKERRAHHELNLKRLESNHSS